MPGALHDQEPRDEFGPAAARPPAPRAKPSRLRSIAFALAGLRHMIAREPNARIHLAATVLVALAGALLRIDAADWRWIALAVGLVWCAEAINTAFERLCDVASPGLDEGVRIAKDVAAGAVLVTAAVSVVVGALTFAPYLADMLSGH